MSLDRQLVCEAAALVPPGKPRATVYGLSAQMSPSSRSRDNLGNQLAHPGGLGSVSVQAERGLVQPFPTKQASPRVLSRLSPNCLIAAGSGESEPQAPPRGALSQKNKSGTRRPPVLCWFSRRLRPTLNPMAPLAATGTRSSTGRGLLK